MKSSNHYEQKETIREHYSRLKNILNMSEDASSLEKTVTVEGVDHHPWCLYIAERTASFDKHPEYTYLEISLYIYEEIIEPVYYTEIFNMLRSTKYGDVVHIYINSPGGFTDTVSAFSSAIEESEAVTIAHVDGCAYSAAFILAFICDEVYFSEFSQMMSHNVMLSMSRSNAANTEKYLKTSKSVYKGMLEKYCKKILTQEEIDSICEDGTEIHLSATECKERLEKWKESNLEKDNDTEQSA